MKRNPTTAITTPPVTLPQKKLLIPPIFLPDSHCVICGKSLEEVGGRRITAQQFRGITISDIPRIDGKNDCPSTSLKLSLYPLYLVTWGRTSFWTQEAIQGAIQAFHKGKRSWFCQICGKRTCSTCGAPINYPMGSDLLDDDGSNPHLGIFPFNPGCINPMCQNFKENKPGKI